MAEGKNYALYFSDEDLGKPQRRSVSRNAIRFSNVEFLPYTGDGRIRLVATFDTHSFFADWMMRTVVFIVKPIDEPAVEGFKDVTFLKLNKNPIKAGGREFNVFAALL